MEHTNRSVPTPAGGGLFRVGVDVGGTAVKIGLTDSEYNLTASISVPTGAERGAAEVLADIGRKTRAFLEEQGVSPEQCAGAGFGIPGVVDRASGRVVYSNNLRWQDVRAEEALSACLPMPIRMANDADCAALGETVAGAGRGCRDVVMLTLGTGVGGGVVIDGRILSGSEPGHAIIVEDGEPCTCGRRGCWEAYVSATALRRDAERAAGKAMAPEEVFAAAAAGDPALRAVTEAYIRRLGLGIANMINIFHPQILLVGGGLSQQGEVLLAPVRELVRQECFGGPGGGIPPIETAALGNRAGMIGAAALLREGEP